MHGKYLLSFHLGSEVHLHVPWSLMETLDFHAVAPTGALKSELWPGGQGLYQNWNAPSTSVLSELSLGSRA